MADIIVINYVIGVVLAVICIITDAKYNWVSPKGEPSHWTRESLILCSLLSWMVVIAVIATMIEEGRFPSIKLKLPDKIREWLDTEL